MRGGIHMMVHEILENAAKLSGKNKKMEYLQDNNTLALRDILKIGMDESINSVFPEGPPPYTPNDTEKYQDLEKITGRWAQWCTWDGKRNDGIPMVKREASFIGALESVHPKEAELMIAAKDKKLIGPTGSAMYKGITKKLVKETFPDLIKY